MTDRDFVDLSSENLDVLEYREFLPYIVANKM